MALLLTASLSVPAAATVIGLSAVMDCAQANAGAGTCGSGGTGTGSASLTYDDITNNLNWSVTWSGLSGAATSAHFHGPALPNQNAGVQVLIGSPSPAIGMAMITDLQATDLLAGLWYVNIHSTTFPGGEIRGQITQTNVPEPATFALMGLGLAGIGYRRKKAA